MIKNNVNQITLEKNNKKTYIIGDVHGCYYTLLDIIKLIPKNSNIIFLGDLIDKGLHSKKVINFIRENKYISLMGNHEVFFLKYAKEYFLNDKKNIWSENDGYGGKTTLKNYFSIEEIEKDILFIKTFPIYLEINGFFITHRFGLPYYSKRKKAKEYTDIISKSFLNNRILKPIKKHQKEWEDYTKYKVINIFGHDNSKNIIKGKNYFGIDTGLIYGGKLTAFCLEDYTCIQVNKNLKDF